MDSEFNNLVVCFTRVGQIKENETRFVYIKQNEETGEYAVKLKMKNNRSVVYNRTMFFVTAMSTCTLLMAEFGIGSEWKVLK